MPVSRKLIRAALEDLHDETMTNDKWLTIDAFHKLFYTRFDFGDGVDFGITALNKAVT